jgi:uncharacterized protein (TIGR02421 family)
VKHNQALFDEDFIQQICQALHDNHPVRRRFAGWGRLHIDRRLPFLCIYRRPSGQLDKGTERLLLGQASFILIREEDANCAGFKALLKALADNLTAAFGAFLTFEIGSAAEAESELHLPAQLNINTSKQDAPQLVLEALENGLLDIVVETRVLEVSLDYTAQRHTFGLPALFDTDEFAEPNHYWISLNVSPFYRQNGQILPYEMKQFHAGLTHVLRRTFYAFVHEYTSQRPKHFHELGRRSISQNVLDTDSKLAAVKDQFDILFHVTPVNVDEAWQGFQNSGFVKLPSFNYRPRPADPSLLKRQLYAIELERIEDPTLAHIFQSQRDEISQLLGMIDNRNRTNFMYGSLQVYGGVEPWLLSLAKGILDDIPALSSDGATKNNRAFLSAQEFAQRAESLLGAYRQQYPEFAGEVEIRKDIPGILVSSGNLMVGHYSRFSEDRVDATLAHEIGTHMLTYVNGKSQPFQQFHSGMAEYESLQEGLAVLAEYLVGKLHPSRLSTLAARVIAVDALIQGADFLEVFKLLHNNLGFASSLAFQISMRVFRGGGFTKDAVYLKGLSELLTYLAKGGELETLYLGKIALKHIPFVDELRWRKVIKEGIATPHYLQTIQGKHLLKQARQCHSVIDLVKVK